MFDWVIAEKSKHDVCFSGRLDGLGNHGVVKLPKILAAIRMLATGNSWFECDKYVHLGESNANEALHRFAMQSLIYLEKNSCMLRILKIAPVLAHNEAADAGAYTRRKYKLAVILEAVADRKCGYGTLLSSRKRK